MSDFNLEKRVWWSDLDNGLQELLKESVLLIEKSGNWERHFSDYSFCVFPAAKAYEGFLKIVFLKLGFMTERQFMGRRFRVGKALNPDLDKRYREKEGVYDRLVAYCNGSATADELWKTWKECRNILFHWFPKEGKRNVNLAQAREKIMQILSAMDLLYKECKI